MNRLLLLLAVVLASLATHSPKPLPMAQPIVVSQKPLELFSLSEQRDSLVVREARRQGVPEWLALSISHAENWSGDSSAVNPYSGAIGLLQIHPVNFGRFPECGEPIVSRVVNVCYGLTILRFCLAPMLEEVLSCYGGATSPAGRRNYGYDVNRRVRLAWLD